ncbi:carbohydrate kinase family protein [Salinarimonas sp.]|uniref:carbohydrate kinase family protein n=1 Tax=Salinarimonas sp. TaxID=2766526 RepID=UPI0032D99CF6
MTEPRPSRILCLGGAAVDRTYRTRSPARLGTSNPAVATLSFGGVARNVAESLARLGSDVALVSRVGDDPGGAALLETLHAAGADVSGLERIAGAASAEYVAVLDADGSLVVGLAAMDLLGGLDAAFVARAAERLADAALVFAEANCAADAVADLVRRARAAPWRLALDAVSVAKSARLPGDLTGVAYLFCARDEAEALVGAPEEPEALARALVTRGAGAAIVTLGPDGLVVADADGARRLPGAPAPVVDVTGAGDALIAGTLHALCSGEPLDSALSAGQALARLAISVQGAVRADLTPALLAAARGRTRIA